MQFGTHLQSGLRTWPQKTTIPNSYHILHHVYVLYFNNYSFLLHCIVLFIRTFTPPPHCEVYAQGLVALILSLIVLLLILLKILRPLFMSFGPFAFKVKHLRNISIFSKGLKVFSGHHTFTRIQHVPLDFCHELVLS